MLGRLTVNDSRLDITIRVTKVRKTRSNADVRGKENIEKEVQNIHKDIEMLKKLAMFKPVVKLIDVIPEELKPELPKTKFFTMLSGGFHDRCYKCNRTRCNLDPYGIYKNLELITIQCRVCKYTVACCYAGMDVE